ncbi:class I SAM-dependent methyltransferase [Halomonas maura]|uniref:class I SAM-dependent methyltransferase n=1 Tax=Halomonas maura TaxID=117606 RepID=UPI0025B50ABE|nr:class I SAM-dependent methyltransferase [Halomonas maura]MDN3555234.1 class I SAM-dependent methyltransferase [Halomonas maura]
MKAGEIKMKLKQHVARITPSIVVDQYRFRKALRKLEQAELAGCNTDKLRSDSDPSLSDVFSCGTIDGMWFDTQKKIKEFMIPDGTGGVNPGDRRAIYYLISAIKPKSVLEIGTHIGASTFHIASALHNASVKMPSVTTVDIYDVNSPADKPWLKHGASHSPVEVIDSLGYGSFVEFVKDTSFNYAEKCQRTFDFIFLDGDHSATTVYQEIPLALKLLNKDGIILLHDYFPNMKPLWTNSSVIPGPFLATERLRREGVNIKVRPLGELPWPTKMGTHVTSLALLLKDDCQGK